MKKREVVKAVTGLAASAGMGVLVGQVVNILVPPTAKMAFRLVATVAGIGITWATIPPVCHAIEDTIDEVCDSIDQIKLVLDEEEN